MTREKQRARSAAPAEPPATDSPLIRLVLDLVPIAWLVLVLFAFWSLVTFSPQRVRDEVPAVLSADRAVLPLLALLMLVAIIRYFSLRNRSIRNPAASSAVPSEGRDRS